MHDPSQRFTFEVVLFENGDILTRYQSAFANGAGAAIGLENETGTVAFVYSNNTPSIAEGTAILFTARRPATIIPMDVGAWMGLPAKTSSTALLP